MSALAAAVLDHYRARCWRIATAESCTGGMIAAALTDLAGSSDVFDRGFVTYSNTAKTDLLGVDPALIAREGAVSEAVVRAMASGALARSEATAAVAVTGIAGPGGGSDAKPVGTVWFGLAGRGGVTAACVVFPGDRSAVRSGTVEHALAILIEVREALLD